MTLELKHPFVDPKPDGGDTTIVRPSDWNAHHPIIMSPGVIGRTTSGDGLATVLPLTSGASGDVVLASQVREILTDSRYIYCRYNVGVVAMSISSPCIVSKTGHGLQINDPVVFHKPLDASKQTTISIPGGVVEFIAGNANTPHTIHGYAADDPVLLMTTGALPTNLTAGVVYYVRNPTSTTFELALTPGGVSIATSGTQSGYHRVERASTLPGGGEVVEGQVYFIIATGFTADSFQFSATLGGAAVNTSGAATKGKITVQTGNDANDGLTLSRAGATLDLQTTIDRAMELDFNNNYVGINLADSVYLPGAIGYCASMIAPMASAQGRYGKAPVGGGTLQIQGHEDHRGNTLLRNPTGAAGVSVIGQHTCNIIFRMLAVDMGQTWAPAFQFYGPFNVPAYVEHISLRGTPAGLVATTGGEVWVHGMMEIVGSPTYYLFDAYDNGKINYIAPGADYFHGVIAYGTKTLNANGGIFTATRDSVYVIANWIAWEGTWAGAPTYRIDRGSKLYHARQTGVSVGESTTFPSTGVAPVVKNDGCVFYRDEIDNLTASAVYDGSVKYLAANFAKTDDTFADITGFTFDLIRDLTYSFEIELLTTSDVAAGIKFNLAGTATLASLVAEAQVTQGTSIVLNERVTAVATTFGDITAVTTATIRIKGFFSCTARGNFKVQFAQNVTNAAASTILAGSTIKLTPAQV